MNSNSAHSPIKIVLVETSHPGNIGATARAMKTMGQTQLCLVRPKHYPSAEATALASGADDVLAQAQVFDSLGEAIADCTLCLGVSARQRSLPVPVLTPRAGVQKIIEHTANDTGSVAILFGRERTGLINEEMDHCHCLISIPANPDYSSLNVAMAVQIIAYELYQSLQHTPQYNESSNGRSNPLKYSAADTTKNTALKDAATVEEMQLFYQHLETTLIKTAFLDPDKPRFLMRRLKRLFNRSQPDKNEINILRGFLTSINKTINS